MAKVKLPKSLLDMPAKDRDEIVSILVQASKLPKTKVIQHTTGDEHNMWERNGDPLLAQAEDGLYQELFDIEAETMAELFLALGLPTKELDLKKSFGNDFMQFEEEIIKAKDSGRTRMSKWIAELSKKTRQKIMKWATDGKALTRDQVKKIDDLLASKVPDYGQKAEEYMIRAGFIGKLRRQSDRENMEIVGAVIDRFPKTIEKATKEGVNVTRRGAKKEAEAKSRTIKVEPLTSTEAEAVQHASLHAGDKITEISGRHRAGVRQLVIQAKRERWTAQQLASKLFDAFGEHNRDWRRVAITELAFAQNDAFIAGVEEGETVLGMGAVNACQHCKRYVINKTFTVTHKVPKTENYHSDMNLIWVGKSNYGRRVAEYRPALPMHPNCRCRWHLLSRFYKLGDNGKIELKSTAELIQEERAKRGMKPDPNLQTKEGRALTQEELAKKAEEVLRKLGG